MREEQGQIKMGQKRCWVVRLSLRPVKAYGILKEIFIENRLNFL